MATPNYPDLMSMLAAIPSGSQGLQINQEQPFPQQQNVPVSSERQVGTIDELLSQYLPNTNSDQVMRILQKPREEQGILSALIPSSNQNINDGNMQLQQNAFAFPQSSNERQPSQGIFSKISDYFKNNDIGNRITDWGIGLSMGSTPSESLSLGAQNLYQGNIGRQQERQQQQEQLLQQQKEEQQRLQTSDWVRGLGYDEGQTGLIMSDPKLFNSVITNRLTPQQVDSLEDVKREKYLADIEKTRSDTARLQSQASARPQDNLPNPPSGYRYQYDSNTGEPRLTAIEGGPAAQSQEEARIADERNREAEQARYNVVQDTANDIRNLVQKDPRNIGSYRGMALSEVPGTDAATIKSAVSTLKANSTFDQLQKMRQASKTGAALGAVSDTENKLLADAVGSLDTTQSREQFMKNLDRVQAIFASVVDGQNIFIENPNTGKIVSVPAKEAGSLIRAGGRIVTNG